MKCVIAILIALASIFPFASIYVKVKREFCWFCESEGISEHAQMSLLPAFRLQSAISHLCSP